MNGSNLTREHTPLRAELVEGLLSSMRSLGVRVGTRTELEEATPEGVEALRAFVEVWSREPRSNRSPASSLTREPTEEPTQ